MSNNKDQKNPPAEQNENETNGHNLIGQVKDSQYGKLKYISIVKEMQKSYLDYAMSVIVSRALPDVRDGLKPVHRRILYSMYKSGIHHKNAYKKAARIVGDVLGKYHPHGDQPVYMALVRLAQEFSMRYPLIDGQGNFGSIDGDSPAAMRYTEARLDKISQELLTDLDKDTVKFVENFDGSMQEPVVLPGRLPNLLLMGSEGIAVGMATKIPPHNLTEVCQAIKAMIAQGQATVNQTDTTTKSASAAKKKTSKAQNTPEISSSAAIVTKIINTKPSQLAGDFNSEITFDELTQHIQAPDFPTGGIIYDFQEIQKAYQTGKGRIVTRAKATIEENKKGGFEIIVTELPYQVNKARLIKKIANLVKNKKIPGIRNVRDDSDRQGLQVTIELKRDARPKVVLNKLFKYSKLQTSFPMNMVALNSDGIPQLMNLRQVLREYIGHRQLVVVRRSQHQLQQARDRAHILEGLLIALKNLDDVIETIKKSADTNAAHQALMKKFGLSDPQATAILEMQLKRLAALERQKIEDEYKEIQQTIKELVALLSDPKEILAVIVEETDELINLYGDDRRSQLVKGKAGEFSEEDLVANEPTMITLTKGGYIKRLNPKAFRSQSRGGKGSSGLKMKEEDMVLCMLAAQTHDTLLFFTNLGRVFKLKAFEIKESSRQAKGTAIVNLLSLQPNERIHSILTLDEDQDKNKFITLITQNGLVKKSAVSLYDNIRQNGIIAITLNDGDQLVTGSITSGQDHIMLITHQGKSIRFGEQEVKSSQRDTKGVKGIALKKNDYVIGAETFDPSIDNQADAALLVVTENGLGKRTQIKHYPVQKRSGLGVKVSDVTKKSGKIASARLVTDKHQEVVISTKSGQAIKLPLTKKSIPFLTRPTQGVILMKLKKKDQVVAVALTIEEE
ncbi:MAG: DNA gyrase subunit A [Candidatus Pacebacteria bacterium]|nr:DNA gyrase subunit A [Candidatus Paceibacterota bacterium]